MKEKTAYIALIFLVLFLFTSLAYNLGRWAAIQEEIHELDVVYKILMDYRSTQSK